ncbi:hypothetical protein [Rhodobacter sp. 24-YEA-8]|uniref:hypothetical protein n=1 Tax=Rhodobacter sp. 24-YEA-8 TaxID=1884310 RepID=UPI00149563F4|nr:hypothetical protein [Rhodobacter sp. 24-YEA-8]
MTAAQIPAASQGIGAKNGLPSGIIPPRGIVGHGDGKPQRITAYVVDQGIITPAEYD